MVPRCRFAHCRSSFLLLYSLFYYVFFGYFNFSQVFFSFYFFYVVTIISFVFTGFSFPSFMFGFLYFSRFSHIFPFLWFFIAFFYLLTLIQPCQNVVHKHGNFMVDKGWRFNWIEQTSMDFSFYKGSVNA